MLRFERLGWFGISLLLPSWERERERRLGESGYWSCRPLLWLIRLCCGPSLSQSHSNIFHRWPGLAPFLYSATQQFAPMQDWPNSSTICPTSPLHKLYSCLSQIPLTFPENFIFNMNENISIKVDHQLGVWFWNIPAYKRHCTLNRSLLFIFLVVGCVLKVCFVCCIIAAWLLCTSDGLLDPLQPSPWPTVQHRPAVNPSNHIYIQFKDAWWHHFYLCMDYCKQLPITQPLRPNIEKVKHHYSLRRVLSAMRIYSSFGFELTEPEERDR